MEEGWSVSGQSSAEFIADGELVRRHTMIIEGVIKLITYAPDRIESSAVAVSNEPGGPGPSSPIPCLLDAPQP